jgi:hypothetical protein
MFHAIVLVMVLWICASLTAIITTSVSLALNFLGAVWAGPHTYHGSDKVLTKSPTQASIKDSLFLH